MARHLLNPVRRVSARSSDACVVKQNHLTIRCQAVCDRWVPAIHVGVEVLQKNKWNAAGFAEAPIGKRNIAGLDELTRHSLVRVVAHP
jgi:hypothetical protein